MTWAELLKYLGKLLKLLKHNFPESQSAELLKAESRKDAEVSHLICISWEKHKQYIAKYEKCQQSMMTYMLSRKIKENDNTECFRTN